MSVTDIEIENALRKRLFALENLPLVLMPFDPEAEDGCDGSDTVSIDR
ncbi:MAG: hypothetical protein GKS00_12390 [Alphaproteobacteria bacterium]|nr:hypothetical protein [Alphaproteobacteria bacterium]